MLKTAKPLLAAHIAVAAYLAFGSSGMAGVHLTAYSAAERPSGTQDLCREFRGACHKERNGQPAPDLDRVRRTLETINRQVNRELVPLRDPRGIGSLWSLPQSGSGDCKHFALLKKKRLIESGVPAEHLLLAIVLGQSNDLHAVLVSRTSAGDFVLDDLHDRLMRWDQTGYTFLKMQNTRDGARWDAILEGPRARRS
jgi:predicted transglutaminase-like cysteine proteinase